MSDRTYSLQLPLIHEHDFSSKMPVVGPLIGFIRRTLYSLTAKWAVKVVIDQQNQINQNLAKQLTTYLNELEARLTELDARLIAQDHDLTRLSRLLAESELRQRYILQAAGAAQSSPSPIDDHAALKSD